MKIKHLFIYWVAVVVIAIMASSCRTVSVQQAANGKAKCGKWLK